MALEQANLLPFFQEDPSLQKLLLKDVQSTRRPLGRGSFGSVEEVIYCHAVCAGKKIHSELFHEDNVGLDQLLSKYRRECQLMADLRHPNIVQFLGLCFLPDDASLPVLVMERMEMSLDSLLEVPLPLPISLKLSVLIDVAKGLNYLHDRDVIHRDLTARNVLLSPSFVAKITDLGNSRIVDAWRHDLALTNCPGTLVYMPPEATDDSHQYTFYLDIFSFGHLSLYLFTQVFPSNLRSSTYPDPNKPGKIIGVSEVDRRREYIGQLESKAGRISTDTVGLIKECLDNDPNSRPSAGDCLSRLEEIKESIENDYEASFGKVDLTRIMLEKEKAAKDREINLLGRQNERLISEKREKISELEASSTQLQELRVSLAESEERRQAMEGDLEHSRDEVAELMLQLDQVRVARDKVSEQLQQKSTECSDIRQELQEKTAECERKSEEREIAFNEMFEDATQCTQQLGKTTHELETTKEKLAIISQELESTAEQYSEARKLLQESTKKLTETTQELNATKKELSDKCTLLEVAQQTLKDKEAEMREVHLSLAAGSIDSCVDNIDQWDSTVDVLHTTRKPLAITCESWQEGPPMPTDVLGYVQSVVIEDCLYISYSYSNTTSYKPSIILRLQADKWTPLPSCDREAFAMVALNNQLTLVGGKNTRSLIKSLKEWHDGKWVESMYPAMPTGRFRCSAVADAGILVVVGGWESGRSGNVMLDSISLLDTRNNGENVCWKNSLICMPEPCHSMRSVVIAGTCYFMGGSVNKVKTSNVFCVSFQKLVEGVGTVETIKGFGATSSTPFSHGGILYAVGGQHATSGCSGASDKIMAYNESVSDGGTAWSEVGTLPQAMWECVCAVKGGVLVVCGGETEQDDNAFKTFCATLA